MRKTILSTMLAIGILSSCQEVETYITPYEFKISKEGITAIEDGRILYYDTPPYGSLDGLGIVMFGGRAGYTGEYIADTSNQFFKNFAEKYEGKIFPILPKEKIPK